jgi:hypothetical protein
MRSWTTTKAAKAKTPCAHSSRTRACLHACRHDPDSHLPPSHLHTRRMVIANVLSESQVCALCAVVFGRGVITCECEWIYRYVSFTFTVNKRNSLGEPVRCARGPGLHWRITRGRSQGHKHTHLTHMCRRKPGIQTIRSRWPSALYGGAKEGDGSRGRDDMRASKPSSYLSARTASSPLPLSL